MNTPEGEIRKKFDEALNDQYDILTVSDLYDIEYPEEEWLVDRILPQTGFTLIVGESGTGKSYLSLHLAKCLTTKDKFLENFEVSQTCPVLVIDKENGLRRAQKRLKGLGMPASNNVYFLKYAERFRLDNQSFLDVVTKLITEKGIKVIILDSLIDLILGNENDSGDISDVFESLRKISQDVVFVLLHHDSKPLPKMQRTAAQKTRGSSNLIAQVDYQFYLEKTKNPKIINIEQGKARDYEPLKKFEVEFLTSESGELSSFRYLGEVQEDIKVIEQATNFIYQYISNNPMASKEEIFEEGQSQGFKGRTLQEALGVLHKKKLIDHTHKPGQGNKLFYFSNQGESKWEEMTPWDPRI